MNRYAIIANEHSMYLDLEADTWGVFQKAGYVTHRAKLTLQLKPSGIATLLVG